MTHAPWLTIVLSGLALASGACGPPPRTAAAPDASAAAEQELRAASLAWDRAHNAGDVDSLALLYAEAAVSMPYQRPALDGRTAIAADFRAFFADFDARHTTTIVTQQVSGDWAIEHGRYAFTATPRAGGRTLAESGKHIVVRRRLDGAWKVQWEIWNTDAAPGP